MKTIGLIGGLSWESSVEYYRLINEDVRERLGGLHSASVLLYSFDFAVIEELQHAGRWDDATGLMVNAANALKAGGADFVVICSNTMHRMAAEVEDRAGLPLVHIADATARAVREAGLSTLGLLGSRFTMEEDFYRGRLSDEFGVETLVPDDDGRTVVDDVIYRELCAGELRPESRRRYIEIIGELESRGAQGVILGCTEIGLLIKPGDVSVPLFDTTALHAKAAVDVALM